MRKIKGYRIEVTERESYSVIKFRVGKSDDVANFIKALNVASEGELEIKVTAEFWDENLVTSGSIPENKGTAVETATVFV